MWLPKNNSHIWKLTVITWIIVDMDSYISGQTISRFSMPCHRCRFLLLFTITALHPLLLQNPWKLLSRSRRKHKSCCPRLIKTHPKCSIVTNLRYGTHLYRLIVILFVTLVHKLEVFGLKRCLSDVISLRQRCVLLNTWSEHLTKPLKLISSRWESSTFT